MANVSIARRYARALVEVGAEINQLDHIGEQLAALALALEGNPELMDVMVNPAYSRPQRVAVAQAVGEGLGGFGPELLNFVRLLVDRNRMIVLKDIARLYRDLADARAGRVRGKVTSAVPLDAEAVQRIASLLATMTQRTVVLETEVDPASLGGVSAQVGSVLYDGSLRTQLEQMRRTLQSA